MISCTSFIPRGAAAATPLQYEPTAEEIKLLTEQQNQMKIGTNLDNSNEDKDGDTNMDIDNKNQIQQGKYGEFSLDLDDAKDVEKMDDDDGDEIPVAKTEEEFMKQLNMDAYDEEEVGSHLWLAGKNLTVFNSNTDDPFITIPDHEDQSDEEDNTIKSTDSLILVGNTKEKQSLIEVYLYDDTTGSVYVHHDFYLPSFPLCLSWMDQAKTANTEQKGNYVAVGTFLPAIEIWDVDMMDAIEPVTVLGGHKDPSTKKKKKKKKKKAKT